MRSPNKQLEGDDLKSVSAESSLMHTQSAPDICNPDE